MISIENASLKSMLGELLGALLGIHLSVGHTFGKRHEIIHLWVENEFGNTPVSRITFPGRT